MPNPNNKQYFENHWFKYLRVDNNENNNEENNETNDKMKRKLKINNRAKIVLWCFWTYL